MSTGDSITDASIADIRWRLGTAMENLDGARWNTALQLIDDAHRVCEAMIEAVAADRRREARLARPPR